MSLVSESEKMSNPQKRRLSVGDIKRAAAPSDHDDSAPPKLEKRERSIEVGWYDPDLADWRSCVVVSRIMDGDERIGAGRAVIAMTGNIPWVMLPEDTRIRITAICQVSMQVREMPTWMQEAIFIDLDLLMLLHRQCVEHDMVYLRPDGTARKENPKRARVSVVAIDPASAASK